MANYVINKATLLFKAPERIDSGDLMTLPVGTRFAGGEALPGPDNVTLFIKTTINDQTGYVLELRADEEPIEHIEPIAPDQFADFQRLVELSAENINTDPIYLMAVAYAGTNNLTNLGDTGNGKIGPFQFTAQEWEAAITTGPAKDMGIRLKDRFSWREQPTVAALLAADCVSRLRVALGRLPTRLELYFAQLFGPGAEKVLMAPIQSRCQEAIKGLQTDGAYAAELAQSDQTIEQAMEDLRTVLATGLVATGLLKLDEDPSQFVAQTSSDKSSTPRTASGGNRGTVPQQAIEFVKNFEGFVANVYDDGKGVPTIGWGTTRYPNGQQVKFGDPTITKETADSYFHHDIEAVMNTLESSIPYWAEMNDNQRSALISFAYNLGEHFYNSERFSTITSRLREKRWGEVPAAMEMYSNPGDPNIHAGLLKRRKDEGELWKREIILPPPAA